jgi:Flp pilus assembly protein TadG
MNAIRTRRRPIAASRRGGALVEAALVLPVVITFLFGILEYGRYVMTLQVMSNAAREGAHYALTHTQPVTISGVTYGNATSAVTNVVNQALAGQSLVGQTIQVYKSDSLGNNIGSWTTTEAGELVCVRIDGNYRVLMGGMLYGLNANIPVRSQVAMRSESN